MMQHESLFKMTKTARVMTGWGSVLLSVATVAGCGAQFKGAGAISADASRDRQVGASACAFEPVLLTVHPLTRLTRSADGTGRADVHFELFDRYGHPVKALGDAAVEMVTRPTAAVGGTAGEQIGLWGADLTNPATNADAYDPVTRTYRLLMSEIPTMAWLDETVEVQVRFVVSGGGGRTLRGTLAIEVPR